MSNHHQKRRPMYPRVSVREQALVAQRKDLEGQLDTALHLLRGQGDNIANLEALAEQRRVDLVALRGYG